MKKFMFFLIAAMVASTFTSCEKNEGKKDGGKDDHKVEKIARIKAMGDYKFAYNADGTVASVTEDWGDGQETHTFVYNGTSLQIKVGDVVKYDVVLNADGLATSVKNCNDNDTYTYEYDKNGFCISCKKNGVDQCQQSIDDYNIQYWTRAAKKDDGTLDHWRHKDHTYSTTIKNISGIHTEWAEDFGQKRWFYETGLLGRASEMQCVTAQWDDAEKIAKYEYETDANGLVIKETKMYGMPDALEFDDEKTFEWELLK